MGASRIPNNFKGTITKNKGVSHCEGYDHEEFRDEIMDSPLSEPFFTKKMKMLIRPVVGFMLYGSLGVDFFFTFELPYPNNKTRLPLMKKGLNFYIISDNHNVNLGVVDCSIYTPRIGLENDYHRKRMDMLAHTPVEFNYLETVAMSFCLSL